MVDLLVTLNIWDSFYGVLSAMMQPLYWAVSGLVVFFHWLYTPLFGAESGWNWTLAIISLTVVIRTLLIPLFVKQINSARSMQMLQPKMAELQKKHGHDRERLGQETMKMYKEEGVSPTASCLPLLLQMPIFLALFRVLEGVSSGNVRGHFFKINPDLVSSLQNAEIFGARLADRIFPMTSFGPTQARGHRAGGGDGRGVLRHAAPVDAQEPAPESLTGPMAQQQKMMLYLFPVIYAASSVVIPIGVLIYWLTSNLWTMGQQGLLIRNNPAPNTPAFIEWEERMLAKGKDPQGIMIARAEKRRGKTGNGAAGSRPVARPVTQAPDAEVGDGAEVTEGAEVAEQPTKVTRQQVTRQTVRTSEDGKPVVVRQQPKQAPRSARKKK